MEVRELRSALDEIFDQAVVYHAYTDYLRDYELIAYATADPRTGVPPTYLRYLFKYCVEADTRTTLTPDTWRGSLDERLTDPVVGPNLDGYVWGVKWQPLYPGAELVGDSQRAQQWTAGVGIEFHEVRFHMNGHRLTLVFSDLEVTEVAAGYTPYMVTGD